MPGSRSPAATSAHTHPARRTTLPPMRAIVFVAIGAALGGVLRHVLGKLVHGAAGHGFPYGTLAVNLAGCLAIGVVMARFAADDRPGDDVHHAIAVGLLGGFTTFSAFGRETIELVHAGRMGAAFAYVAITNVAGLAAVWLGWRMAT